MCVCVISHHMAWLRNGHSCCYGQSSYVRVELQMGGVRKVVGGGGCGRGARSQDISHSHLVLSGGR